MDELNLIVSCHFYALRQVFLTSIQKTLEGDLGIYMGLQEAHPTILPRIERRFMPRGKPPRFKYSIPINIYSQPKNSRIIMEEAKILNKKNFLEFYNTRILEALKVNIVCIRGYYDWTHNLDKRFINRMLTGLAKLRIVVLSIYLKNKFPVEVAFKIMLYTNSRKDALPLIHRTMIGKKKSNHSVIKGFITS